MILYIDIVIDDYDLLPRALLGNDNDNGQQCIRLLVLAMFDINSVKASRRTCGDAATLAD